jgi:predicted aspartyl protease
VAHACALAVLATSCAPRAPGAPRLAALNPARRCARAKLGAIPAEIAHGLALVPFRIDGVESAAVFDTGSNITLITPDLASQIAPVAVLKNPHNASTVNSTLATQLIQVKLVEVGHIGRVSPEIGVADFLGEARLRQPLALVGLDTRRGLDLDLDFDHELITAYRTANCVRAEPPWPTRYTGVPIAWKLKHTHVAIPVTVAGNSILALIDTGAERSSMTRGAALRAGVTDAQIEHGEAAGFVDASGAPSTAHMHRFAEIGVGQDVLYDAPVMIVDKTASDLDVDMVLGMDYLATHHVWLSLSTAMFYIDSGVKLDAR